LPKKREWGISAAVERWAGVAFMIPFLLAAVVLFSFFASDRPIFDLPIGLIVVVSFPYFLGLLAVIFLAGLILVIHSTRRTL
jgi:hypothetical protein